MPRTCIICGQSANSREHIFPAALGGLRVNRGIYCALHNNSFSHLAGILSRQLGMWNALLGVLDRERRPRVLQTATPTGDSVIVSKGQVRRVEEIPFELGSSINIQIDVGGSEGLPAIGYIALTFFAHYFGSFVRQDGFSSIKSFIQRDLDNHFVWWESDSTTRNLPNNHFEFGHTVVLTTSAQTGKARALISLFQTLTFGIDLGQISNAVDQTVTVFIDPHADRQPLDIQERRSDAVELNIEPPVPMHAHLERMVLQGHGQDLLSDLMARIQRWHFESEMQPSLERLNAAKSLPPAELVREIQAVVEDEGGRVHRVMRHVVQNFIERFGGQAGFAPIIDALSAQVQLNARGDNIADDAEPFVVRVLIGYISALSSKLQTQDIDMDYFYRLFSGGVGLRLAGEIMFEPIQSCIGMYMNTLNESDN